MVEIAGFARLNKAVIAKREFTLIGAVINIAVVPVIAGLPICKLRRAVAAALQHTVDAPVSIYAFWHRPIALFAVWTIAFAIEKPVPARGRNAGGQTSVVIALVRIITILATLISDPISARRWLAQSPNANAWVPFA